jgi:membrane protein required for colicin V production
MSPYDIFMLVILAAAVIFGFWKGLAWQVASLAAIIVSYFVALNFSSVVAGFISTEDEKWARFLAMFILYIGTSLAVWIAFGFVHKFLDDLQLKSFDKQAGGLLGAVKGALLCIVITLFAVTLLGAEWRRTICQSKSGYYIAQAIDSLSAVVPSQYHEVVAPYIEDFNKAMDDHSDPNKITNEYVGEFVTVDPNSVNGQNTVTGSWQAPDGEKKFDLNKAAKKILKTAQENLGSKNENK